MATMVMFTLGITHLQDTAKVSSDLMVKSQIFLYCAKITITVYSVSEILVRSSTRKYIHDSWLNAWKSL